MYNLLLILIIYEILFSRVHSVSVLHVCYVRYSIFFLYFGEIFPERKKIITYLTFIAWHYSMWWYIQPPYQPHVFNFVEKNSEFFPSTSIGCIHIWTTRKVVCVQNSHVMFILLFTTYSFEGYIKVSDYIFQQFIAESNFKYSKIFILMQNKMNNPWVM